MIEYEFEKRQRAEMLAIHEELASQETELAAMQASADAASADSVRLAKARTAMFYQDGM